MYDDRGIQTYNVTTDFDASGEDYWIGDSQVRTMWMVGDLYTVANFYDLTNKHMTVQLR